jgi:hypothetical protein
MAYRRTFDTPDGKLVLHHLMQKAFITDSTFVASDPHQTALNEGSRRIVLSILKYALKNDNAVKDEIQQLTEGM